MLEINGGKFSCCDGISRRNMLKAGFLGLGGLSLPPSPNLLPSAAREQHVDRAQHHTTTPTLWAQRVGVVVLHRATNETHQKIFPQTSGDIMHSGLGAISRFVQEVSSVRAFSAPENFFSFRPAISYRNSF